MKYNKEEIKKKIELEKQKKALKDAEPEMILTMAIPEIKGFAKYDKKVTENLTKLYTEIEKLYTVVGKALEKESINNESLIDVNNSLVTLQQSLLEKGLRVKHINKLEEVTKSAIENLKEIKLPKKLDITNVAEIKQLPKWLASEESLKQVNKNLANIAEQLGNLETNPPGQNPKDFVPFRRVYMSGNRLVFDDTSWSGARGSGGSGGGGVAGEVIIKDAGGEQATVTNGKLDVNATVSGASAQTDVFNQQIIGLRNNQIEIDYSTTDPDANSLLTITKTNGGDATNTAGQAVYSTSTNANGEIKAVTTRNITYHPHAESYVAFTAIFATKIADSFQRIGLYDDNNGFFIGYEGTSFGVTRRSGASDTTTAQASFSEDDLTGAVGSEYTRNGTPEAADFTKDNLFRIRFGWLGAAPIYFEILAPDGNWVTFHIIKHPNTAAVPSVQNPDLPIRLHIKKTAAAATNLTISTACWAAGTTSDLQKITSTLYDETLAKTTRSVITGQTSGGGGGYVNVKVTPSGSLTTAIGDITGIVGQNTMANSIPVTIASNQSSVTVNPSAATATSFSVTSPGAISSIDVGNYGSLSIQITSQGTSSTVTPQWSNDNTNWASGVFTLVSASSTSAASSTTTGIWFVTRMARYFRLNITGISAGTTAGTIIPYTSPIAHNAAASVSVSQSTAANLKVDLSGTAANATAIKVDGSAVTQPISNVALSTSTNALSNATSTAYEASRVVKASSGRVYGLTGFNSAGTALWVQLHNTTSVPADGVAPVIILRVPTNSSFSLDFGTYGRYFDTGITICNSTTGPTKTIGASNCWFDVQYL